MHAPAFTDTSAALVPVPVVTVNDKLWSIVAPLAVFTGAPVLHPRLI